MASAKKTQARTASAKKTIGKTPPTPPRKAASKKVAARKAPAKKTSSRFGPAIVLLMDDHKQAKACFEEYEDLAESGGSDHDKKAIADKVCAMLTAHTTIEEELFYPAARKALGDDGEDMLDEAEVEHGSAKELIAQIMSMKPGDDLYDAKVHVLGEYIDHHVKEEETEMFPECQKSDLDQETLAAEMGERKARLMAAAGFPEA